MRRTNKTALYLDVAIVLGFAAIGFGTAWRFDVFESFSHWAKRYENWNVDELVLAALTGSLGLLFATLRGYRNVRLESRQRLRAERALAESNRRHLQILETVRDGIFGVDGHGRISFVNPAVADLLGCEPHELLGWDSHALFCEPDGAASSHQPRSCPVVVALGTGTARAIAGESFQRRDGSLFAVEGLASPIVEDGSVTGAVVTFRDITERREVERLKDEFTSVVSHELRTPLTSIMPSIGPPSG